MNGKFDVDAFLGSEQTATKPAPTSSEPSMQAEPAPAGFDVNSFLGITAGEPAPEMPAQLNGSSFDSPLAGESAVDVADRFKLAVGNEEGKLSYLKSKFGEGNVVKNSLGALSVKGKDNKWRLVDPDTLDAPDSWELTKRLKMTGAEALGEVAELIPTAVRMASGLGKVAGVGTLGATAAAGAGADLALTSMGRAFGTYQGSVEDQLKDATFEGALNALGWGVEKGMKPTLKYIAKTDMFKTVSESLSSLTNDSLSTLKTLLPVATGGKVTESGIETVAKYGKDVDRLVKSKAGADPQQFSDLMRKEAMEFAGKAADSLELGQRSIADRLYGSVADDVAEGSIKISRADLIDPLMKQFSSDGALKIAGKSWEESTALLQQQGGKLLKDQSWAPLSFGELNKLNQRNVLPEAMQQAAADPKAYKELMQPINTMLNYRSFKAPEGSKEQVKAALKLRQSLSKITYEAKQSSDAKAVSNYFVGADSSLDQITKAILPEKAVARLAEADAAYSDILRTASTLKKVANAPDANQAEQLINAMFSKGGAGVNKRNAIQNAYDLMIKYQAPSAANAMADAAKEIQLRKAATEFTTPMFKNFTLFQAAAVGSAVNDISEGDPSATSLAAAGSVALGSPANALRIVKTQLAANAVMRSAIKTAVTPAARAALREGAIKNLVTAGYRAMDASQSTKQQLMSQIPGGQGEQP